MHQPIYRAFPGSLDGESISWLPLGPDKESNPKRRVRKVVECRVEAGSQPVPEGKVAELA